MLQWMGGSRRKVATSRKSTYKRQKQYFEQRRRQQHQTTVLEDQDDRKHLGNQYCEYNRSLDILSLMNVSTVTDELTASCLSDNLEDDHPVWNNQNAQSPDIDTNEVILVDQSEQNEERTCPSYPVKTKYSERVSVHVPDHREDLVENGDKPRVLKLSTTSQISVIDLLGDGEPSNSLDESSLPLQEAHVAFSVEGLGKVETKTPVHSPEMPRRRPVKGFSPPRKACRRPFTFEHLDNSSDELDSHADVMMRDILLPQYGSSMEQRFSSRELMDSNSNQIYFNSRNSTPFNWDNNTFKGASADDEILYDIQNRSRSIWDGPGFLDDNINDLEECRLFCEKRMGIKNVSCDDYFNSKNSWRPDFKFEDWNLQTDRSRSSARRTGNFDLTESPVSYLENLRPKDFPGFNVSHIRYPTIGIDSDVKYDVKNLFGEDSTESLSLLSEESCSSTAVRGDAMKKR